MIFVGRQEDIPDILVGEGFPLPHGMMLLSFGTPHPPLARSPFPRWGRLATFRCFGRLFVGTGVLDCPRQNDVTSLWNTSSTAIAVPLPPLGKASDVPMLRQVICRDRRPRLSAPKRCYIGFTHGCFATYTSSVNLRLTPSPEGKARQRSLYLR